MSSELPRNVAAEKALLGGLIKSEMAFWQVSETLRPDHFSVPVHGLIYSAIQSICMESKRVSLTLLGARLPTEDGSGKSMPSYLAVLLAGSEDAGNPIDYVDQIVSTWARRRMIETATQMEKDARAGKSATADILSDATERLHDIWHKSELDTEKTLSSVLTKVVSKANIAYQSTETAVGFKTGLASLDEIVGRFMPGDLIFICGSQGEGKTALATQILKHASMTKPCLLFEQEMRDEDIGRRMLASQSGLAVSTIEEGDFNEMDANLLEDARRDLEKYNIIIDDRPKLKVSQIKTRCMGVKRSRGLGMVAIDHLRLIQADIKVRDIFERTEYVTGALKALAKELNVPLLCLAQRTRGAQRDRDEPTPQITDMFGGGSIEQDADSVIGVWRRDMWLMTRRPKQSDEKKYSEWLKDVEASKNCIEAISLKRRRGSAMGIRKFKWNGPATQFEEIESSRG